MKSKPAIGALVLVTVALVTWAITTTLAATIAGGREEYLAWRSDNLTLFLGIWVAELVVIGLPALWIAGKKMGAVAEQQDKTALAARGVGNLAASALRGDEKAIARLLKLLDDGSPAVRYQSARALAILDDKATNEALFRKVRYWDGNLKLGLIDVLRRTMDLRTIKLLREFTSDRNPMVARKARTALTIVSSRSGSMDDIIAKRRDQAQARQRKEARKKAKAGGAPAEAPEPNAVGAPAEAPEPKPVDASADVPAETAPAESEAVAASAGPAPDEPSG